MKTVTALFIISATLLGSSPMPITHHYFSGTGTIIVKFQDNYSSLPTALPDSLAGFTHYIISKGEHRSKKHPIKFVNEDSLVFALYFDSTAIYTTNQRENQGDINKIYGFSDCNSPHEANSARFGWRYFKYGLELFAYTYAGHTRSIATLGSIKTGRQYICTIVAKNKQYVFYLDGKNPVTLPRKCSKTYLQYMLHPYFGGNEKAPHNINIWIKKLH